MKALNNYHQKLLELSNNHVEVKIHNDKIHVLLHASNNYRAFDFDETFQATRYVKNKLHQFDYLNENESNIFNKIEIVDYMYHVKRFLQSRNIEVRVFGKLIREAGLAVYDDRLNHIDFSAQNCFDNYNQIREQIDLSIAI